MGSITIRTLEPTEWPAFREMRLAALKETPHLYSGSYEDSLKRPDQAWHALVSGPTHQVFGLFDDARLIGITAVFASDEDPSGQTAMLAMSHILPEYRRRGLSRMLHAARFTWIHAQPQFKRVTVSVRESNLPSRRASERSGFKLMGRQSRAWRDGATEDEVFYELRLD